MGRGGKAFEEGFGSLIFADVGLDGVGEGGNICEVGYAVVLSMGDGEGNRLVMSCHCFDNGVHPLSDQIDMVISFRVVLLVADDRFADGNSAVDL